MPEHDIKRRASELLQKGRLSEAIHEYEVLLEQSKRPNPAIINLIGDIYIKQGNHSAGFAQFHRACKHYADEGLFHNGIAVAKKILRLDKDQTDVYRTLGDLYARQGLGMDAVKFLNEFARRKEEANEYPAALAAFAHACETLIECPEISIAYGEMLERVERGEEAAQNFRVAAEIYADRGLSAQSEHWRNRAHALLGEEAPPPEATDDDEAGVWDVMSLRSLDEKSKAEDLSPPARSESRSRRPGSGVHPRPQWNVYDPGKNPGVPPPPPLPGDAPTEAPVSTPVAAADLAPPTGVAPADVPNVSLVLEDPQPEAPPVEEKPAAEASPVADDDGLTLDLDLSDLPFQVVKGPTSYAEAAPVERAAPKPPRAPVTPSPRKPEPPPEESPAAVESPGQTKGVPGSLSGLPGIIMPPSAQKPAGGRTAHRTGPQIELPVDQAPPPGRGEREQAIIIGDDTELVREGGDVNEVINDFREATSQILGDDDHQAHYDLGTTYLEMELFEEAASEFEMAAGGAPFALVSQEMLGYCYLRQGHIDRAVAELRKGLALETTEPRAKIGLLYNLGIACGVLGRDADAIDAFRRVHDMDPGFRDTKTRLERLDSATG